MSNNQPTPKKIDFINETWMQKNKGTLYLASIVIFLVFAFVLSIANKPNACECARILNVPTETVGYKKFPIANIGNEEYKKFAKCQDTYTGAATAILACAGN